MSSFFQRLLVAAGATVFGLVVGEFLLPMFGIHVSTPWVSAYAALAGAFLMWTD